MPRSPAPRVKALDGRRAIQSWPLSLAPEVLGEFLHHVFRDYWDQITFGPVIEGAAYEWTCPSSPHVSGPDDGYLTISFGTPHFHICVGGHSGKLAQLRQPSRAEFFRRLDGRGAPISWGFQMENGGGQPMISIFFPSPFVTKGDHIESEPRWERLRMWQDLTECYLGLGVDAFDMTGVGYVEGNY